MVRVRIAPTPSGKLHLGTAHTALFNYLFAKHHQGSFILRIDDSDPKRTDQACERDIVDSLRWLGLDWDEGVEVGGDYGPYRQSERMDRYWPYVEKLLASDQAYYCYCTPEELAKERDEMRAKKLAPKYSGHCRDLTKPQITEYRQQGRQPVVRLRVPDKKVFFVDPARGKIEVDARGFGDFVIARSDRTALLVLASTIDDIEMKISHTIRGEDYINFVPRQLLLFEALGIKPPIFAHLPFVYAADGSKLSKRHGAVAVSDYRQLGYLPEAVFNYLLLLGWSPGEDEEIISKQEAIKRFKLEQVNTNAHRFDIKKLNWINGVYIRQKSDKELAELIKPYINSKLKKQNVKLLKIASLIKERITTLAEAKPMTDFFVAIGEYDKQLLLHKKADFNLLKQQLQMTKEVLGAIDWQLATITQALEDLCQTNQWHKGQFFMALRVAITGKTVTPPLFESLEILGKEETLKRLDTASEIVR
ncbi:glutamate--tRNA ligase [Patescibacteria group bacterium]|nr:glutamate--tRNA ligase [Patescibacteria group bacterium]MBU1931185.1 glutamate--tRNA ligase [Patescibacteria group bacterium]